MKIETNKLTKSALDWAVAKARGIDFAWRWDIEKFYCRDSKEFCFIEGYSPSTNQDQGGKIIDEDLIDTWVSGASRWSARLCDPLTLVSAGQIYTGPTRLIAAMRCRVGCALGSEIEIPEKLC